MKRKSAGLVICCLLTLLLTGCWDRAEVEDQAYAVVIGLDYAPPSSYIVTAMVAMLPQFGAGALQAPVVVETERLAATLLTSRAETMGQALQVMNGGLTRRLDVRHLRAVIVGETLGEEGLKPLVMELLRSPLARTSAIFLQAKGSAHDVMTTLKPVGEVNPARMAEGISLQAKQIHLAPPVLLHHWLNRLAGGGADSYLPAIAINEAVAGGMETPQEQKSTTALPGKMPRAGGNPVEMIGTAVFRSDRLAGFLNVDETQMLLALRGKMGKASVTLTDPLVPDRAVTMRFHQENFPRYRARYQASRPHVDVHMLFEGEVLSIPSGADYGAPEKRMRLEKAAGAYVQRTCEGMLAKLHEWRADPVGFGQLYRGRFASWEAWNAYDWPSHVDDLEVKVTAEMRVRRYGLILGRPDLRGR